MNDEQYFHSVATSLKQIAQSLRTIAMRSSVPLVAAPHLLSMHAPSKPHSAPKPTISKPKIPKQPFPNPNSPEKLFVSESPSGGFEDGTDSSGSERATLRK